MADNNDCWSTPESDERTDSETDESLLETALEEGVNAGQDWQTPGWEYGEVAVALSSGNESRINASGNRWFLGAIVPAVFLVQGVAGLSSQHYTMYGGPVSWLVHQLGYLFHYKFPTGSIYGPWTARGPSSISASICAISGAIFAHIWFFWFNCNRLGALRYFAMIVVLIIFIASAVWFASLEFRP